MLLKQTKDVYLPMIQDIIITAIRNKQDQNMDEEKKDIKLAMIKKADLRYGLDEFFSFCKAI